MRGAFSKEVRRNLGVVRGGVATLVLALAATAGSSHLYSQNSGDPISKEDAERFNRELDSYEKAAKAALEENARKLVEARAKVRAAFKEMLDHAHKLPDGRRVFKSKDGTRVFDQDGRQVPSSIIDPREISDRGPPWEIYESALIDQETSGDLVVSGKRMMRRMPGNEFSAFVRGMIEGMAYARFRKDTLAAGKRSQDGMDCILTWYHENPKNFLVFIDAIRKHEQHTAWVVLGSLLKKECGE